MTRQAAIPPSAAILTEIIRRIEHFRRLLKKVRTTPTPKTIHDVRISIRRLEAAADFYLALSGTRCLGSTTAAVESLMKPLGKLRDLHVQRELIRRHLAATSPLIRRYAKKLREKMHEYEGRVLRAIKRFPKKGLTVFAAAVEKDLGGTAGKVSQACLQRLVLRAQKPVEGYRSRYCARRSMKIFHKMRISLKHLRYTGEMLVPVVSRVTERDVERIHALQREMGTIRDMEVLSERLRKYITKKDGDPAVVQSLQKITATRDALVKRFNAKIGTFRFFDV